MALLLRDQNGFTLAGVLVASGLLGIVSLGVMQLTKNLSHVQGNAKALEDVVSLKHSIRTILNDPKNCRISLAGEGVYKNPSSPVTFSKEDIDEDDEGLDIELHLSNQVGDTRSIKKFNGSDAVNSPDKSKFGSITIKSMKLIMNNGNGFNYINNISHRDVGVLRVKIEKKTNGVLRENTFDYDLNLELSTGQSPESSGTTRIVSCEREESVSAVQNLKCYTLRLYEKRDDSRSRVFIGDLNVQSATEDGLSFLDVATSYGGVIGGSEVSNPVYLGSPFTAGSTAPTNSWWGIECNQANNFFLMSCAHGSNDDNDTSFTKNGCYANDNDGDMDKNFIDVKCCRFE